MILNDLPLSNVNISKKKQQCSKVYVLTYCLFYVNAVTCWSFFVYIEGEQFDFVKGSTKLILKNEVESDCLPKS